ncbi:MAG: peptidoglycan DD-metalloendopeptidase family protein [Candidatus Kerfeldbacteria bacterium]|nr:peptidoglycan DD-metalloendopeptidase family protein [Candidatus Kerfeldbacteria bacterium]
MLLRRLIVAAINLVFRGLLVLPYSFSRRLLSGLKKHTQLINPASFTHHQLLLYLVAASAIIVTASNLAIKKAEVDSLGKNSLIFPLIEQEAEFSISEEGSGAWPEEASSIISADQGSANTAPADIPLSLTLNGGAILKPHLVTTQPGIAGRDRVEKYVVRPGDNLSIIAQRFGLKLATILWENRLNERSTIRVGQTLTILPTDGVSYRVGRGDTATKLASRFRAPAQDIIAFNHLEGGLVVGQTIIIPGGRPPAAPQLASQPKINIPLVQITPPKPAVSSGRLLWPTTSRRISQYYSWRHTGVDLPNSKGTPIYAAEDGIVETAGWNRGGYGYYIIIDHGGGLKTLYAHNSKNLVTVGGRVTRGQLISDMGSTGRSTGSHVHFEVRVNGRRINPLLYIR